MNTIITVENLSKKYIIGHQKQREYQTFRDTLSNGVKSIYQRLGHPFSPNAEQTDTEEFWALKDINFEIKQGDRVGIIGRNGAGKSTLLKILSKITQPTTGKIHLKGRVASLLEVGTGFHPELTGRENIFLNGAILGMTKNDIKLRFDEIVAFAEIEKFLDTPVKRYSSGMYVRLAFAVAAHLEPEILLVDEVLAVGDALFQKKCLGKMENFGREGRTVILVSHNMSAIEHFSRNIFVIDKGGLLFSGETQASLSHYNKLINTSTQLADHSKRNFNKYADKIYIHNVWLKDAHNNNITGIKSGDDFIVSIEINDIKLSDSIGVGVIVKNNMGQIITSSNTFQQPILNKPIHPKNKKQIVNYFFPGLNVPAGEYYIDFSIAHKGISRLDYLENALMLIIEDGKIFPTGEKFSSYHGFFYVNGQWIYYQ